MLNLTFCLIVWIGLNSTLHAKNSNPSRESNPTGDSTKVYKERMPERTIWEEVAYFPGRVVYFPLKWTLKGFGELVGIIDDTKIIQQLNDKLESDDGRRKLQFTYASRTGGGAKYYQNGIMLSRIDRNIGTLTATAGISKEQLYQATFEDFYFAHDLISADFLLRYQKLTTESFYEFGMDSRFSDESTFTLEQTLAEATLGHDLLPKLRFNTLAGYEVTNIAEGYDSELPSTLDNYTEQILPGIRSVVEMVYTQVELDYDTKDRPGNPKKGYEVSSMAGVYQQVGDDKFGFLKYTLDVRKYLHLFYNRVLVMRVAAEINDPLKNRKVPFYYLSELGREETIRGFERGRFRENDMLLASLVYRYPVWHFWNEKGLDVIIFTDTGQVLPKLQNDVSLDNFETGYGIGFRLWDWKEGLIVRFQVGWSDDGMRIYLGLN